MDLQAIRQITVKFGAEGDRELQASLDRVDAAFAKAGSSAEAAGAAAERGSGKVTSAAARYDGLNQRLDGAYRAARALERGLNTVDMALGSGATSAEAAARTVERLMMQYQAATIQADRYEAAQRGLIEGYDAFGSAATMAAGRLAGIGQAGQLSAGHLANMQYQLNDIAVSLAAGQSPFTVLLQQGMQVSQMFEPGTSLATAGRALATGFTAFLNPLNMAVVGVAAVAGAATLFFSSAESETEKLTDLTQRYGDSLEALGGAFQNARVAMGSYAGYSEQAVTQLMRAQSGAAADRIRTDLAASLTSGEGWFGKSLAATVAEQLDTFRLAQMNLSRGLPAPDPARLGLDVPTLQQGIDYYSDLDRLVKQFSDTSAAGVPDVTAFHERLLGLRDATGVGDALQTMIDKIIASTMPLKEAADQINGLAGALHNAALEARLSAERDFNVAGLEGYARGIAEIGQKYDDQIAAAQRLARAMKGAGNIAGANVAFGDVSALEAAKRIDQQRLTLDGTRQATKAAEEQQAALARAGLPEYAAGLDEINRRYMLQMDLAAGNVGATNALAAARRAEIALYQHDSITKPLEDEARALGLQRASLQAQADALGGSAIEQQRSVYLQEQLNGLMARGIPITSDLADRVGANADAFARLNVQQSYLQRLSASIEALPATQVLRLGEYTAFLNDQMAAGSISAAQASAAYRDFTDSMDFGMVDQMADALNNLGKSAIGGFSSATDALKQFTGAMASITWDTYISRPIRDALRNGSTDGAYGLASGGIAPDGGLATGTLGSNSANPMFVSVVNGYAPGGLGGQSDAQSAIDNFVGSLDGGTRKITGVLGDVDQYLSQFTKSSLRPDQIAGLQDSVSANLATAMAQAAEAGLKPVITEMFRTYEDQATLYANRASNPYPVAAPGNSAHESGLAVDISVKGLSGEQWTLLKQIMTLNGFSQPVANDAVHWVYSGAINDAGKQVVGAMDAQSASLRGLGDSLGTARTALVDLGDGLSLVLAALPEMTPPGFTTADQAAQAVAQGKAVEKGAERGLQAGLQNAAAGQQVAGLLNGNASVQTGMQFLAGVGGLANSFFAGQQSGDPLTGAISGAVGGISSGVGIGTALLGPLAMAGPAGWLAAGLGALLGGGLGIMGANSQSNHDQEQARLAAYKSQYSDRQQFIALAGGEAYGTIESTMNEAFSKMEGLAATIEAMKDPTGQLTVELNDLRSAYGKLGGRLNQEFADAFTPTLDALRSGQGLTGAFGAARQAMIEAGDSLRNFVADAKQVQEAGGYLGGSAVMDAEVSARKYALSMLAPVEPLSKVAQRLQEIDGTATGLTRVLSDLDMSASDAASAISYGVSAALAGLRGDFVTELGQMTNTALDKGYLNDAAALIKQRTGYLNDASLLGLDSSAVDTWFGAAAQKLVNEAELTGTAFDALIAQFPELTGAVTAFSAALTRTEAEIASAISGYEDRLFTAMNDNSTLAGQIAAIDRQARREREAEIAAGGAAIVQLEAALAAERWRAITDGIQTAFDGAVSAFGSLESALSSAQDGLRSAITSMQDFIGGVADFRAGLKLSDDLSVLDPLSRLTEAQRQYETTLAAARLGDKTAMSGLTGSAQDYLGIARDYYSADTNYADIFTRVNAGLSGIEGWGNAQIDQGKALVDLNSTADSIAQAIDKLSTAQADYDLGKAQIAQMAALGAGILDVANWTAVLNGTAGSGLATIAASLATVQYGLGQINGTLAGGIAQAGAGTGVAGGQTTDLVTWLYRSVLGREPDAQGYADWWSHIRNDGTAASAIVGEFTASAQRELAMRGMRLGGLVGAYAGGGIVGNGLWDVDSVIARYAGGGSIALAGGEYVMPAPQTGMYRGDLDAMRAGTWSGASRLVNDNRPVVDAIQTGFVATHRAVVENGRLLAELVDEVRALREENAALRRDARQMAGDPRLKRA